MFTLFHFFALLCAVIGFIGGLVYGTHWFGLMGGIIGAPCGALAGLVIGWMPVTISSALFRRKLKRSDTSVLIQRLEREYYVSHHIIAELVARGEPVDNFRRYIVNLIRSDLSDQRWFGYENLKIWFPELAKQIDGFDPSAPMYPKSEYWKKLDSMERAA